MIKVGVRGFTLIEILIVIVLFATGAVVLLQIFGVGLYGCAENENMIVATALAQVKMEEIRNEPYDSIAAEARAQIPNYTLFEREVLVTTPRTNIKQVTVTVYWPESSGDATISLVTYISNVI